MEYQMKALVEKAKEGDVQAKAEILQCLMPLVRRSIKKFYFGEEALEDLMQDGWVKILEAVKAFDERKGVPFLGYVKLQLQFLYMEKRKKQRREVSLNNALDAGEEKWSFIDLLTDEKANVEEKLLREDLGQALQGLTPKQKKVMVLYYGKGWRMKDIAKKLGIHYQTVAKTKKRAIQQLRIFYR